MGTVEDEIKANYPDEVYQAYIAKEKYAKLNPENTGVLRLGNLNSRYGLSPVFRSLSPQLMLDVLATTDKSNASAKGKKIIVQLMRKEMIKDDGDSFASDKWMLAHSELMKAWKNPVVVYTALPFVEDMKYVESKTEQIPIETINYYKNKVLMALGISFLSVENKSSYVISEINIKELMKTINKISEGIEECLCKWYKVLLRDNGIDPIFTPTVQIIDSEMLEVETKIKLIGVLFGQLGASFQTCYSLLGVDYENEKMRREEENAENAEITFAPRLSAYTVNSDAVNGKETKTSKSPENTNKNKDQRTKDSKRYDSNLSDI